MEGVPPTIPTSGDRLIPAMTEYFIDCCEWCFPNCDMSTCPDNHGRSSCSLDECPQKGKQAICRCSIGNLTADEMEVLECENSDPNFVIFRCAEDIPCDTGAERLEHSRLLSQFELMREWSADVIFTIRRKEKLMTSKIILDEPALLDESLVSLTAACKCFPAKASRASVERWLRRGSRGAVLESILICGKRYTSKEAIDRFIRNQLRTEPDRLAPSLTERTKRIWCAVEARQLGRGGITIVQHATGVSMPTIRRGIDTLFFQKPSQIAVTLLSNKLYP